MKGDSDGDGGGRFALQPRSFINSTPGGVDITRDITYAWTGLQTILYTLQSRA